MYINKYIDVQSFMCTCIYLNKIFKLEKKINAHCLKYGGVRKTLCISPKDFWVDRLNIPRVLGIATILS